MTLDPTNRRVFLLQVMSVSIFGSSSPGAMIEDRHEVGNSIADQDACRLQSIQEGSVAIQGAENVRVADEQSTVEDLVFHTVNEKLIKLSAFRGRILLLHFWWSECADCKTSFRILRKIHAKYSVDKLGFLGASIDNDKTVVARIAQERGLNWPQCANEMGWINRLRESQDDYASPGKNFVLPRCWVFDDKSRLRYKVHPSHAETMINLILKQNS